MECNKEHFCHSLFYYFDSKETIAEPHRFVSETYSEIRHQVKHVSIDFDDSKVMILI